MRRILYTTFSILLVIFNISVVKADEVYYINREHIEMTEQEYNNLLGLGFTEKQIYRMDYQTFIDNKDIEGEILSQTQQYLKTTITMRNGIKHYTTQVSNEAEYLHSLMTQQTSGNVNSPNLSGSYYDGMTMDEYQILTTHIIGVDDDTLRYKIDMDWLTMPSTRSWDIIGIGIQPSRVQISSLLNFRQDWLMTNYTDGYDETGYTKEETTGASAMIKLPSGSLMSLESYLFFEVIKQPNVGTLTSVMALGDYAHAITNITDADDAYDYFSINHGTGIEIDSPYHNSYIDSLEAAASFTGTW